MRRFFYFLLSYSFLLSCQNKIQLKDANSSLYSADAGSAYVTDTDSLQTFPFLVERVAAIKAVLQKPVPVLKLTDSMSAAQLKAQELALAYPAFIKNTRDTVSKQAYRNEIFQVYAARESDFTGLQYNWKAGECYRVEMYNYPLNLTTMALVDVKANAVIAVNEYLQSQPDIPAALHQLALKIAIESPALQEALGVKPSEKDALMSNTKTALNRTRCERSRHLCVAPTFVKNDRALWAIVDLTDYRLVGLRWTNVGTTGPPAVTERKLQDDKIQSCFCDQVNRVERDGWRMDYMLTASDGLKIADVRFNGKPVLTSAKLVDWHVNYSNTDGFGYSDAVGCPAFSQAAVVAFEPPRIATLKDDKNNIVGFTLEQVFKSELWPRPCNYNYRQRYEFYTDGRFRVSCASLGRGCGNDGTYRPVFRIAFAANDQNFAAWNQGNWQPWLQEQWTQQTEQTAYAPGGYMARISGNSGGYYMEPGRGQFGDGGRGDNAFIYVTKNSAGRDEGESDLVTIGPCCNTDYRQGPEKFIEPQPEPIANSSLVFWYVATLKNDNTKGREYCWAESVLENGVFTTKIYPCFCGPMFTPIK